MQHKTIEEVLIRSGFTPTDTIQSNRRLQHGAAMGGYMEFAKWYFFEHKEQKGLKIGLEKFENSMHGIQLILPTDFQKKYSNIFEQVASQTGISIKDLKHSSSQFVDRFILDQIAIQRLKDIYNSVALSVANILLSSGVTNLKSDVAERVFYQMSFYSEGTNQEDYPPTFKVNASIPPLFIRMNTNPESLAEHINKMPEYTAKALQMLEKMQSQIISRTVRNINEAKQEYNISIT